MPLLLVVLVGREQDRSPKATRLIKHFFGNLLALGLLISHAGCVGADHFGDPPQLPESSFLAHIMPKRLSVEGGGLGVRGKALSKPNIDVLDKLLRCSIPSEDYRADPDGGDGENSTGNKVRQNHRGGLLV